METLIQELKPTQLDELSKVLARVPDGTEVELRFESITPLSQLDLDLFHEKLLEAGFELTHPITSTLDMPSITKVSFIKKPLTPRPGEGGRFYVGVLPLAALVAAIPTALITGLITVGVFKIEKISESLLPLIIVAGAFAFLVVLAGAKPAAQAYAERK